LPDGAGRHAPPDVQAEEALAVAAEE